VSVSPGTFRRPPARSGAVRSDLAGGRGRPDAGRRHHCRARARPDGVWPFFHSFGLEGARGRPGPLAPGGQKLWKKGQTPSGVVVDLRQPPS